MCSTFYTIFSSFNQHWFPPVVSLLLVLAWFLTVVVTQSLIWSVILLNWKELMTDEIIPLGAFWSNETRSIILKNPNPLSGGKPMGTRYRERQQEHHKFAYLKTTNGSFSYFWTFFTVVLVLSVTWNDLFGSWWVDNTTTWRQRLSSLLNLPIARTHLIPG